MGMITIKCKQCDKQFSTCMSRRRFCSTPCSIKFGNDKHKRSIGQTLGLNPSTTGAIGELLVAADLMKRGYEVFRALSPASNCDLLAIKENNTIFFEIRTGRYLKNGKIDYSTNNLRNKSIAIVTHRDNKIHYINVEID